MCCKVQSFHTVPFADSWESTGYQNLSLSPLVQETVFFSKILSVNFQALLVTTSAVEQFRLCLQCYGFKRALQPLCLSMEVFPLLAKVSESGLNRG